MMKFPELPVTVSTSEIQVAEIHFKTFKTMVFEGMKSQFKLVNDSVLDRVIEELNWIDELDLKDYFLFWKIIFQFCQDNNICVGLGRGVINCSIVAYSLGFTHIQPLDWDLPYQRFFNPLSEHLPAFSLDVSIENREKIIQFLKETYGKAHVGALAGRNDDESGIAHISKYFSPAGSGVVVSAKPLKSNVPTMKLRDTADELIVDFPSRHLQNLGCFKFDIFGTPSMDILQEIYESQALNMYPKTWDDDKVFEVILSSKSKNIFPFSNEIMRVFMKNFQTNSLEQLALAYAVSRPGLQGYIEGMLKIHKENSVFYFLHESLQEVLSSTYGYIVYKEQFIQIVSLMSGKDKNFADMMYRNLLEDDPEKHTLQFIDKCEERGIEMHVIQQVMTELIASHPFLFSKAHALGVVMTGYTQIWHEIYD